MAYGEYGGGIGDTRVFDVRIKLKLPGGFAQFGFSLRDVALQGQTAAECAAHVHANMQTPIQGILTTADALLDVDVRRLGTQEGGSVSFGSAVGALNAVAAERTPSMLAVVVTFKSEIRARYGGGRMFLPVRYEPWIDGDSLSTAGVTSLQAFLDAIQTEYMQGTGSGEFRLVTAHPALAAGRPSTSPTPLPAVPARWYDVQSMRLNTVLTSLKSRRAGVGT